MEEFYKDPIHLSKGIKLQDLLNGDAEFQIDMDFKKEKTDGFSFDDDLLPDFSDEDSDSEEYFKNIEQITDKLMLSCPEYKTFDDMAAKMIDCMPSGDVKMLITEEGDGPIVPVDAVVTIHYAAYFEKARIPFDSTLTMNQGQPLQIRLGGGKILPGLEIGLTTIKGPKARFNLLIQPRLAWGPNGVPPRIRPEPALFVIILYDVNDTQAPIRFNDLPLAEQRKFEVTLRTVKSLHLSAKTLFAKKKYIKALQNYQQSLSVLKVSVPKDEKEEEEIKKLKVKCYVNMAVCYFKLGKPKYIIHMCECLDFVTDVEKHCKALFYYGRAYEMLGKYEDAVKYYKKALRLEPKNVEIGKALADLDKKNKKSGEEEKEIWQNAFKCASDKEKEKQYNVDEEFQNSAFEMCKELAGRQEYSKFDFPNGLTINEVECLRDMCSKFEKLMLLEDGEGRKKKISVVKQTS